MMESQRAPSLKDPAAQSKMLLFEGTPAGAMPGFLGPRGQKYPVPYYAYDPREKDEEGLILAWSGPSAGLMEARSAVSHQSGMEGNSHSVYQPYKKTFSPEECHSRSPSVCDTPGKPVSSQYARRPDMSSPLACSSTSVINQTAGRSSASPSPKTSMHLAIPKAVYGQRPCCSERGCVLGQRYGVEHVTQRVPNAVHESDWMNTGAHFSRPSPIHRAAPESSLQQKGTHFEHGGERPLPKDSNGEKYQNLGPCKARTIPGYFESPFSSYPCVPTHTLFGSLTPQNFQTHPNGYHGLLPSHPQPFEHMTSTQHRLPSQVCQELSPMSKYGHFPQHHGFYYPEENVSMEGASVCKNIEKMHRESASAFSNHLLKNVQEHRLLYQPVHGDISMINSVAMPNPSFFSGLDPRYPVPRVHMTTSQVRGSPKEQHTPLIYHTNGLTTSPVGQPHGLPVNLHNDRGSARSHDKPCGSPLNMHVEAKRPSGHVDKLYLSPGRLPRNKGPHNSPHGERFSPPTMTPDRPLDYSCHKVHVITSKQPKDHTDPTAVQMSPSHYGERIHKVYSHGHNRMSMMDTSSLVTNEDHGTSPSCFSTTAFKGKLKRCNSQVPKDFTLRPIKFEKCDSPDEELLIKRQKLEREGDLMKNDNSTDHHPMPIIDNVFSLAPYRALLQASGRLLSTKMLWNIDQYTKPCEDKTDPSIQDKGPREDAEPPDDGPVPKKVLFSNAVKPTSDLIEQKAMKVEKQELETEDCVNSHSKVIRADCFEAAVKEEAAEVSIPDTGPMFVIKKCEPEEFDITPPNAVLDETSKTCHTTPDVGLESSHQEDVQPLPVQLKALSETSSKSTTPPVQSEDTLGTQSTPPFTISKYKLILPDTHGIASRHSLQKPAVQSNKRPIGAMIEPIVEVHKPPVQPIVVVNKPLTLPELVAEFKHPPPQQTPPIHARERFLKLHHYLCNLVTEVVSVSPEQALRDWIYQVEKVNSALSANKNHRISCLLGVEAGQAWLNVQIQLALDKVLHRIEEYISQEQCPFPHVMRTGAVFIPMMVVKKLLFPQVQGGHIDQVLQNRKVELRPTTLSEEKHLTQLHRQAFSSKLRRLMSLKHLPHIYTDVLNLFHHACVSKRLGVKLDGFLKTELEDCSEDPEGLKTPAYIEVFTAPFPGSNRQMHPPQEGETSYPIKRKSKSRVKRCSRQAFLDYRSSSPDIEVENKEQERNWDDVNSLGETKTDVQNGQEGAERVEALVGSPGSIENTWTCPLSSDELSSSSSDMEMEGSSIPSLVNPALDSVKSKMQPKKPSGMILKLRKVLFSKGLNGRTACYKTVSHSGTFSDFSPTRAKNGERLKARKPGGKKDLFFSRRSPKVPHWNQRREGFSRVLCSLSGSRRRSTSRLKIQYCPYLSACHSAEHRRRWVLRSAVQRAQRAIKYCYPDLVGKKILHLYEEDDKSEVWYRGEVVSIHEAHPNPLKNVFEVKYDSEPEWTYFLELLMDFKKGWLKIAE